MAKKKVIKEANVSEEIKEEVEEVKEVKNETKEEVKSSKKDGMFAELKKVVWPSSGSIFKYTLAVILFCAILCGFFTLVYLFASFIKELFQ